MGFLGQKPLNVHEVHWACPENNVRRRWKNSLSMCRRYSKEKISSKPVFLFAYLFKGGVLGPHFDTYYRGGADKSLGTKISPSDPFLGKKNEKIGGTFQRLVQLTEKGRENWEASRPVAARMCQWEQVLQMWKCSPPFFARKSYVTNVMFLSKCQT